MQQITDGQDGAVVRASLNELIRAHQYYGPYANVAAAKAAIALNDRFGGLTVKLINGQEYWWQEADLTDSGLIQKGGAGVPYTGATADLDMGAFSVLTPQVVGGGAVGSTLTLQGTKGNGTSTVAAIKFAVGNNGAIQKFAVYNNGAVSNFGMGTKTTSVFFGYGSGIANYTGDESAVFGNGSAANMTGGNSNTIIGSVSARALTTGGTNTVLGSDCLAFNQTGTGNVAIGVQACSATLGNGNIGIGVQAIRNATTSALNIGIGYLAGLDLLTGNGHNIIIGNGSSTGITTGGYNTIIGSQITGLNTSLSNNIILADGQGNIKYRWNGTDNAFTGILKSTVNTGVVTLREYIGGGAGSSAIYMGTAAPSASNHVLAYDTSSVYLNAPGVNSVYIQVNNTNMVRFGNNFIQLIDGVNFIAGTATGSKVGQNTSEKWAMWGKTPIVQPTTAIASASFVANSSGIANDTATFGGYKIGQAIQAMINFGLLA